MIYGQEVFRIEVDGHGRRDRTWGSFAAPVPQRCRQAWPGVLPARPP
jgi:hypothetical protein